MIPILCLGDSLATFEGVGQYLDCAIVADVGRHTHDMVTLGVPAARVTIISASSNDPPTASTYADLLALRRQAAGRVIWIIPADLVRAALVERVAVQFGDDRVYFTAGPDDVHPASYRALAADIEARLLEP